MNSIVYLNRSALRDWQTCPARREGTATQRLCKELYSAGEILSEAREAVGKALPRPRRMICTIVDLDDAIGQLNYLV